MDKVRTTKLDQGYNAAYSAFIRHMRLLLPLVAVVIAGIVLAWGMFDDQKIKSNPVDTELPKAQSTLISPNFQSVDEVGRPFSVNAREAKQDETNPSLINLYEPVGQMFIDENRSVNIKALGGAYEQDKKLLALKGLVELTSSDGYEIRTDNIYADFLNGSVVAKNQIKGRGAMGTLEAQSMHFDKQSNVLILNGPAKLVIKQARADVLGF